MTASATEIESDEEVREFRELLAHADKRLQRFRRLGTLSLLVFGTGSLCVWLISDKGPFHSDAPALGKAAVLFAEGGLLFAVIAVGSWWTAWKLGREARQEFRFLLEDRYGVKEEELR